MHMTEGATDGGLKGGRYDRLLSMAALITGAAGVIGVIFACLDWSHASLTLMKTPSANLLLFVTGLAFFFITLLLRLWLRTHDKRRIRYVITRTVYAFAISAIAVIIGRFLASLHI
jgi:hypothetical protein